MVVGPMPIDGRDHEAPAMATIQQRGPGDAEGRRSASARPTTSKLRRGLEDDDVQQAQDVSATALAEAPRLDLP